MVLSRQYIQSMEINGLFLVDTRKTCVTFGLHPRQPLIVSCFFSGVREKCPLVRLFFDSFRPCEIDIIISVPRSYKISYRCAMLGGPLWPTSISTSGTSISKDFTTYFHPFSSNSLLGPTLVAIYSPSSILHIVVEHRNLVITQW